MISEKFVILGSAINLLGSFSYVADTLHGETKPNRVSWLMWALAPMVVLAAQINAEVGIQALLTFFVGFGPILILAASFVNRKSVWKITPFDIICGVLSMIGILAWLVTKDGNYAILFAIFADIFAAIPTLRKSYTSPETESYLAFLSAAISAAIVLLTIDNWNFATYAFPIYILVICLIFVGLIKFRWGLRLKKVLA
jgi:hypothetical protein